MFITELMKIDKFVISTNKECSISKNKGKYEISVANFVHEIPEHIANIFKFISARASISLKEVREEANNYSTKGSNIILAISSYLYWGYFVLHIADADEKILITINNALYGGDLIGLADEGELIGKKFVLSRFSLLNREENHLILTKAMKDKRILIEHENLGQFFFKLFQGATLDELSALYDKKNRPSIILLLRLLLAEDFIISFAENKPIPSRIEEGSEVDTQWDFADLSLHANSRVGFNFGEFGGAFPFVNIIKPRPSIRVIPEGKRIDLYQPNVSDLIAHDAPLTQLQMQRISVRRYDEENPISLKQLGEFLYRTSRVLFKSEIEVTNINDQIQKTLMGLAWRPYPTGGASYELEVYVTVDRARDLQAGIYYYAPETHQLVCLSERNRHTESLIDAAHTSCARIVRPQVLLHVAARFQRVSWKYHAIAYVTTLRNTGVLYQTFYLNAIAMGIAPCGLGSGNIREFALATGNDPLVESNVGEFMLGSLPKDFSFANLARSDIERIHGAISAGVGKKNA